MEIVYITNEKYFEYLKRSVQSVKRFNPQAHITVVVQPKFSCEAELKTLGVEIRKYKLFDVAFRYRDNDRMSEEVYYRLFLPDIFLHLDKVLYLDCDVLCQRPLNELWNIETPFICATESHSFGHIQAKELKINKYALSGVMLMNLKAMREDHFSQTVKKVLSTTSKIRFHDEEILNKHFNNRIKFIDHKFNYCHNRHYDKPMPESDAYLLHFVGRANDKREMLKYENFKSLEALKPVLRGKKVAIVGNSETILQNSFGKDIDSHDVVVRFNKGFPKDKEKLGAKTTVLWLACTLNKQELCLYNAKYTVKRSNLSKNACSFSLSPNERQVLQQSIKQPSTGLIALNFALSCGCKQIDLYGFDSFKNATYYNPKGYITQHYGAKEGEKIQELAKYGLINIF